MNGINEGAAMWLLLFFMKKQTATAANSRIALGSNSSLNRQKEGTLTTKCERLNYLLETYFSDDVVAGAGAEIKRFTQLLNETPIDHPELLWAKALCFD